MYKYKPRYKLSESGEIERVIGIKEHLELKVQSLTKRQARNYLKLNLKRGLIDKQFYRQLRNKYPDKLKKIGARNGSNRKKFYKSYIVSREWEERKNDFWKNNIRRCKICDSASFIQVHHLTYERLGRELDADLVALCGEHHKEFHTINGVQKDMRDATNQFIEEKNQTLRAG